MPDDPYTPPDFHPLVVHFISNAAPHHYDRATAHFDTHYVTVYESGGYVTTYNRDVVRLVHEQPVPANPDSDNPPTP